MEYDRVRADAFKCVLLFEGDNKSAPLIALSTLVTSRL